MVMKKTVGVRCVSLVCLREFHVHLRVYGVASWPADEDRGHSGLERRNPPVSLSSLPPFMSVVIDHSHAI